jgi:hypothetical protein
VVPTVEQQLDHGDARPIGEQPRNTRHVGSAHSASLGSERFGPRRNLTAFGPVSRHDVVAERRTRRRRAVQFAQREDSLGHPVLG